LILAVVSGDMIDDTIIARLLHNAAVPTVERFASAIVGAMSAATAADDLEKGGRT